MLEEREAGLLLALLLPGLEGGKDLPQAVLEPMLLQQAHESLGRGLPGFLGGGVAR